MTSDEAPPSVASDLEPLSEAPRGTSVFDFLYHDARRVGSFLAQFETYGVPSQVKATEGTGRSESIRTTSAAGVNLLTVAKADTGVDSSVNTDERDAAERTYDPLWTNARALLDYLTEHNLIQRELWGARVGQFVLAKGMLIVLDVAMLKGAWEKPMVKRIVMQGDTATTGKGGGKAGRQPDPHKQLLIELLTVLPHSIQVHLLGGNYTAWCSLAEASLVGMSSDLVLKHGSFIPGEWHVLGILDAIPDPKGTMSDDDWTLGPVDALVVENAVTLVGKLAAQLAPVARQLLGRPRTSFGLTPLLIFREVSG